MNARCAILDIAELIAGAVRREDDPGKRTGHKIEDGEVFLSIVVPLHLRHLVLLADQYKYGASDLEGDALAAHMQALDAVLCALFASLQQHYPVLRYYTGINVGDDWEVYATPLADAVAQGFISPAEAEALLSAGAVPTQH